MATLTTEYQLLGQTYLGTDSYNHSLYVRIYARYFQQDIENNRTGVQYQARTYFEGGYIIDQQGSGNVSGTSASTVSNSCTRPTTGENIIATTEAWVYHNNDGTQSISCSAYLSFPNWGWSGTASGSASLPTIPRKATITECSSSFNDEQNPYFKFSNPANATLSCWLEINPTGEHLAVKTPTGTSGTYTWNLTETERNQLRAKIPNSNTATCRIGLYSTIGGTTYFDIKDIPFYIVNANPIFTNYEIMDINPITTALTGNSDVMVEGYSTIRTRFYPEFSSSQKESRLVKYIAGAKSANYDSTSIVSIDNENYSGNSITLQVVDSRGNSTKKISSFLVHGYIQYSQIIKNSIDYSRNNGGVGNQVTLSFSGTWWNGNFGQANNDLTISYKFKKTTSTTWIIGETIITPIINDNSFSFSGLLKGDSTDNGFESGSAYDLIIEVSDKLSTAEFTTIIGVGTPAMAIYRNKISFGGKYDTSIGGDVQLWGDVYVNGNRIS